MRSFRSWTGVFASLLILSIFVLPSFGQKKTPTPKPTPTPAATPTPAPAKNTFANAISGLRFREIGPAVMGGRIDDIEAVPSDPRTVYVATAAGGILKSVNGGTSWTFTFDKEAVPSIGDIAITPSNPSIVWAGTGEANNRQSASWGAGIYKSMDAGKTWKFMGLPNSYAIARIVVDPHNPDVVFVAALGNLWGPNPERGVYRTKDGGKTWEQVLKVSPDTGATDIAIDPESPTILYAAMYQRRRTVFGFNGSGPESGLYKSIDGGDTWTKVVKGMPYDTDAAAPNAEGVLETGRIGITVYPKDPNIVYVSVEHANGGVFRSTDKGETWTRQSNIDAVPRPMYFSQLRVDPNNDQRLWLAGVTMQHSDDGGKTWTGNNSRAPHADTHAIWIDPNNSDHMWMGNDGGVNFTWDRGKTWDYANTVPIGQFYEVGADNGMPYKICGGLQDNNAWCGPSQSMNPRGITNDDWYTIGGGDGFYAQPDPNDTTIVYTESQDGNVLRRNVVTGESKSIRPREAEGENLYRFEWNSPIVISSFDSNTIYYGGNFLFKSTNRGDSWTKVGNVDLTTGVDRNKMPIMGKVTDKNTRSRFDGVENWPAITVIGESPLNKNVLWVGTDDGNLQVTKDGQTWTNVAGNVPGLPKGTYVTRVVPSRTGEGTAYATFDGHRSGDFTLYVYVTTDYGQTWKSIKNNLKDSNGTAHVIREHPRNPNLLFLGTEFGLFASIDRGGSWTQIRQNLPTVPVDDILIHPRDNDLILGTHGRSIWVMDDITALSQINQEVLDSDVYLFDPRPGVMYRPWNNKSLTTDKAFYGQNPPAGAYINFYLKEPLAQGTNVAITITDSKGTVIRTQNCTRPVPNAPAGPPAGFPGGGGGGGGGFNFGGGGGGGCTATQGINRFVWDMRTRPVTPPGGGGAGGGGFGGGGFGFGGGGQGFRVDPGDYTVKIKLGEKELSKTIRVMDDPRINMSQADRDKKREAQTRLQPIVLQAQQAQAQITGLRTNLTNAIESWKAPNAPRIPDNVRKAATDLLAKINKIYDANWSPGNNAAQPALVELRPSIATRVAQVAGAIESASAAPTDYELSQIDVYAKIVPPAAEEVRKLVSDDLAALNAMMLEAKIPYIQPPTLGGPGGGRGRPPGEEDNDDPDRMDP
ncbi:MAG: hypothetical protein JO053_13410 [Acidobacteria bacterium]|nr:hypothetical protein [Acidobacteriota bacterium]